MNKKPKTTNRTIVITKGIPASGKSTWAKEKVRSGKDYVRINKDELRLLLHDGKYSKTKEKLVLKCRDSMISVFMNENKNIIIDDTNLHPKHEEKILEIIENHNKLSDIKYHFEIKWFDINLETALIRNKRREYVVPDDVIKTMYNQYTELRGSEFMLKEDEKPFEYMYDVNLPDVLIVDLDGTISILNGRNPYDPSTCDQDLVNKPLKYIIDRCYQSKKCEIVFLSGREDTYRPQTIKFLLKNGLNFYSGLHMRKAGDTRKDFDVKKELFFKYIYKKYNPVCVFDDRTQVCRLWRNELGLFCLQADWGNF